MNKVIETLFERKSVRQFTPQEISQEEKQLILESALQAPTAGNQVLYTILDIDDQSIKDKLINWKVGIPVAISGIVGAIIGAKISVNMDVKHLKKYFGIFLKSH